ncbi:MAG: DUF2845 domain-containing protein [Gammaproteobacteria bacterium]|nr:DUF2845 domain-containing protein [Gammaproteobacteria bacterium]
MNRWCLISLLLLIYCQPLWALRCSKRVVVEGYHKSRILSICGEPDFVDVRTEYLDTRLGTRIRELNSRLDISHFVPIELETWTYNFGPNRLVHHLHFQNNRLFQIEPDGYGY